MGDYIRREDAINVVRKRLNSPHMQNALQQGACLSILRAVEAIPTVELKRGEWVEHIGGISKELFYQCSKCYGEVDTDEFDYCPWCGAQMNQ